MSSFPLLLLLLFFLLTKTCSHRLSVSFTEMYRGSNGPWAPTATLKTGRYAPAATLLLSGKILVTGGAAGVNGQALATAELYDPSTGTFSYTTGAMSVARYFHVAVLAPTGKVIIAGGTLPAIGLASVEIYDPATDSFSATVPLSVGGEHAFSSACVGALFLRYFPVYNHAMVLLPNGLTLSVGGNNGGSKKGVLASAILSDLFACFSGAVTTCQTYDTRASPSGYVGVKFLFLRLLSYFLSPHRAGSGAASSAVTVMGVAMIAMMAILL